MRVCYVRERLSALTTAQSRGLQDLALRDQFETIRAQTPWNTVVLHSPEGKTNRHHGRPSEICKTSTPGSNPGGASTFLEKIGSIVLVPHNQRRVNGLESLVDARQRIAEIVDSSRVVNCKRWEGWRFTEPPPRERRQPVRLTCAF